MKFTVASAILTVAMNLYAQEYHLPFTGRWFVMQGGDTLNVNHHMEVPAQWYGVDFMKVGDPDQRSLSKSSGSTLSDFYAWGEPVLSPVEGEITAVVDGLPDNPIGVRDERNPAGNHLIIAASTNRYVFIAHLQKGSVKVKREQRVKVGQELGKCGNSGNSDVPHIHMHVQDKATPDEGEGQNIIFKSINVELTGKMFEKVDWPMIQGLFVWKK